MVLKTPTGRAFEVLDRERRTGHLTIEACHNLGQSIANRGDGAIGRDRGDLGVAHRGAGCAGAVADEGWTLTGLDQESLTRLGPSSRARAGKS